MLGHFVWDNIPRLPRISDSQNFAFEDSIMVNNVFQQAARPYQRIVSVNDRWSEILLYSLWLKITSTIDNDCEELPRFQSTHTLND